MRSRGMRGATRGDMNNASAIKFLATTRQIAEWMKRNPGEHAPEAIRTALGIDDAAMFSRAMAKASKAYNFGRRGFGSSTRYWWTA